jgi:hypothetical protein
MTLRDTLIGKMANKGFAPVPDTHTDRITFAGMGNDKRVTVMLPPEPEADKTDAAADLMVAQMLRQIQAL